MEGHHNPSISSWSTLSDSSGHQPNLASGGEIRVLMPNDRSATKQGPITWEAATPVVRTEPIPCSREQEAWKQVCVAINYETSQLAGEA